MRRLHGASTERSLMVTLGLLLILVGVATALWNPQTQRIVYPFFEGDFVGILGVNVSYQQLLTVGAAVVIAVAVPYFLRVFRIGVAMRAVVDDPDLVALAGAKPYRVAQMAGCSGSSWPVWPGACWPDGGVDRAQHRHAHDPRGQRLRGGRRRPPAQPALDLRRGHGPRARRRLLARYLSEHVPQSLAAQIPEIVPVVFLFIALLVVPAVRLRAIGRLPTHAAPRVAGFRQSLLGGAVLVIAVALLSWSSGARSWRRSPRGLALGIVALLLGAAHRLRRAGLALPDDLLGRRCVHHGQGGPMGAGAGGACWPRSGAFFHRE